MEVLSGDVLAFKAQVWASEHDSVLDGLGYHGCCYISPPSCWCNYTGEEGLGGLIFIPHVEDAPNQGGLWTQERVPIGLVAYLLSPYYILMSREWECRECLCLKVHFCCCLRRRCYSNI